MPRYRHPVAHQQRAIQRALLQMQPSTPCAAVCLSVCECHRRV